MCDNLSSKMKFDIDIGSLYGLVQSTSRCRLCASYSDIGHCYSTACSLRPLGFRPKADASSRTRTIRCWPRPSFIGALIWFISRAGYVLIYVICSMAFDFFVLILTGYKLAFPISTRGNTRSKLVKMVFSDGLIFFIVAFLANLIATVRRLVPVLYGWNFLIFNSRFLCYWTWTLSCL